MAKLAGTLYLLRILCQSKAIQKKKFRLLFIGIFSQKQLFGMGLYELQIGAEMSSFLLFVHGCADQSDFCMIPTFAAEALQFQPTDKHSI
jgi:hypothetical protein